MQVRVGVCKCEWVCACVSKRKTHQEKDTHASYLSLSLQIPFHDFNFYKSKHIFKADCCDIAKCTFLISPLMFKYFYRKLYFGGNFGIRRLLLSCNTRKKITRVSGAKNLPQKVWYCKKTGQTKRS